ncbi:MAG TPA: ECF transporter S component [Bacteroides sp.]|nr:ECF transporter S component [Bacteroides propionicigenes]HBO06613.1 ECF transporter S component [Bacteroides sp.]
MFQKKLYSLDYSNAKTYLIAALFIAGNMALPQLFHLIPQGGITWLPIYFFTLISAYKFGWKVGLLTAVLSVLLAVAAGWAVHRFNRISLPILLAVVLFYQVIGTLGEWVMAGSFFQAVQDFRIGLPGMAMQVAGGYALIKYSASL